MNCLSPGPALSYSRVGASPSQIGGGLRGASVLDPCTNYVVWFGFNQKPNPNLAFTEERKNSQLIKLRT